MFAGDRGWITWWAPHSHISSVVASMHPSTVFHNSIEGVEKLALTVTQGLWKRSQHQSLEPKVQNHGYTDQFQFEN